MDSTPNTAGKRSSTIPRFSKLPLLNARPASGIFQAVPSPEPSTIDEVVIAPAAVIPKPTLPTSKLTKRSSIATLPRPSIPTPRETATQTRSNPLRSAANNGLPQPSRSIGVLKPPGAAPVQRTSQIKRPQSIARAPSIPNLDQTQLARAPAVHGAVQRQSSIGRVPPTSRVPSGEQVKSRLKKPSRPSLADRTIESLNAVPTTPKDRRRSDFFNPGESPMSVASRPGSSLSTKSSLPSRPGSSQGGFTKPFLRPDSPSKRRPNSVKPVSRLALGKPGLTPSATKTPGASAASNAEPRDGEPSNASLVKVSPIESHGVPVPRTVLASSTPGGSKSLKPRPSLGSMATTARDNGNNSASAKDGKRAVSSSSSALRQQIAAAKAAAKKEKSKHDSPQAASAAAHPTFDVEDHQDPFNTAPKDEKHILKNKISRALTDGRLNIAALGLKEVPSEVRNMYDAKAMEESNVNWAEVVDLSRFIAADNELESLDDALFPDLSNEELSEDDTANGNQFGGLELLDLHGNLLSAIPLGLRRLERLTILNVAHNRLENAVFDVLAQMPSLREIRLGDNVIGGNLPASLCVLPNLEILDLQNNKLLGLPEAIGELGRLRVLNVSGNQLTTLPMDSLQELPLVELDASSNLLIASLFPLGGANGHPTLQMLNVANNSLAALTFRESLEAPQLRLLNVTNNHLTVLPSVGDWVELTTLLVGDNKIAQLPQGFTRLRNLRTANFTSNELRLIDPEVCRMGNLETLTLAANPLREKKFLTMSADNIKRELKARMTPSDHGDDDDDVPDSPVTVIGSSDAPTTPTSAWSMKANGVLELVAKNLSDEVNDILGSFLKSHEVRELSLQSNKLTCIPPALWLCQELRCLDLSDNPFAGSDYLSDELELPTLQELSLSKCRLTTLEPLLTQLRAPNLRRLNVCANRLSGSVPHLRRAYPQLSTFLASDNKFEEVSADALRGVANANLASNNIASLPAELGLLWDEGLRHLDVSSNAFRVPNYRILERGTEATLRWLRNKIPAHVGADVYDWE